MYLLKKNLRNIIDFNIYPPSDLIYYYTIIIKYYIQHNERLI